MPLYRRVASVEHPGLYFIGLIQPLGAIMPIAEAQSEWVADLLEGRGALPTPAGMRKVIAREDRRMAKRYVASKRHTIQVDFYPYMRTIARERRRSHAAARCAGCSPGARTSCASEPARAGRARARGGWRRLARGRAGPHRRRRRQHVGAPAGRAGGKRPCVAAAVRPAAGARAGVGSGRKRLKPPSESSASSGSGAGLLAHQTSQRDARTGIFRTRSPGRKWARTPPRGRV